MDFISTRIEAHPAVFVYHYANYEESALKRLANSGLSPVRRTSLLRHLHRFDAVIGNYRMRVGKPGRISDRSSSG
jgi:hypothetical protein